MKDVAQLLHNPGNTKVRTILEQGLISPAERGVAGDIVADRLEKRAIYFFHPNKSPDSVKVGIGNTKGYQSGITLKCEVATDELYVADWGDTRVEKFTGEPEELTGEYSGFWKYNDWKEENPDLYCPMFMNFKATSAENIYLKNYPSEVSLRSFEGSTFISAP